MPKGELPDAAVVQAAMEGLELQRQRIAGQIAQVQGLLAPHRGPTAAPAANPGLLPLEAAVGEAKDPVARIAAEIGGRPLDYVTLTRVRQSGTITGYGTMCPLVTTLG